MVWRVFLMAILILGGELRAALAPVPIEQVRIDDDAFWSPKREVWRRVTINDCFDKFEKDGAFENFDKVRDGRGGKHGGPQWYDGLVYEMITGGADFLREKPDEQLQRRIDGYVKRIAAAADKDPNGYINTHTQLVEPNHRWGQNGGNDREQHDLYNAGCLVEAGVHYYRATGQLELLRVAARLANHMCDVMGPPPRKNIIPGHAISEATFIELYRLFREQPELKKQLSFEVDERRYLDLAQFWIDARGHHEGRRDFGAYDQDHKPVLQQESIEGHAVRATLLATGLTELASATGRDDYRNAARRLWENMTARRMYVTGGLGAIANDEEFGGDYVLPNDGYLETCAAVGAAFFHQRMNLEFGEARFADELERVLYNGALAGVSISGNRYFYENPLEAGKNKTRWPWHACPCCPPMFLKLMGAMPGYIYATSGNGLYVNLYASSTVKALVAGKPVALRQTTRYPWEGDVRLAMENQEAAEFDLYLRVPSWCQATAKDELYKPEGRPQAGAFVVKVNGEPVTAQVENGYAKLRRKWQPKDVIEVHMQMPPRRVVANEVVAATKGRVALMRGPIVYCMESIDNDGRVRNVFLPEQAELRSEWKADLLGGVNVIRAPASAVFAGEAKPRAIELTAIPFYANANRAPASRRVWIPTSPEAATPGALAEIATSEASHVNPSDTLSALNDGVLPKDSADESIPRFTWWNHRGTAEWVQYTFDRPMRLGASSVYWWDERRINRHCRVPASWRLCYQNSTGEWLPVNGASSYGTEIDKFNRVTFDPIETTAIRIEAQLQAQWSGGILEWAVEEGPAPAAAPPTAKQTVIRIDAKQEGRGVSRYLTGACIEDVNHEIYGGIFSQMIFGESFAEPPRSSPVKGFVSPDGQWMVADGVVDGGAGPGPKLISSVAPFASGEAGVEVYFDSDAGGNAGLIVRVDKAGAGADNFDGYEVSIDLARKRVVVGRHRHDWRLLKEAECDVVAGRWIALSVKLSEKKIEVFVDGKSVVEVDDPRPLSAGTIGLRQWQRPAKYRNLWVTRDGKHEAIAFERSGDEQVAVSGMWRPIVSGSAKLAAAMEKDRPFIAAQSQCLSFLSGEGEVGIENQGLNRWGMNFVEGKEYEGDVWMRAERPAVVFVSLESRDGARRYDEARFEVSGNEWKKYSFVMIPGASDPAGRFAIRLKERGSVFVGHASLQPGEWGRFKGLPLRRDVVQGLVDQGITVLRYGGSMVNAPEYRWRNMIGPREKRPPYRGTWYPYSSNGWGIVDFLDLCQAAGFAAIPDFNIDETPEDMADFVQYVQHRVPDGHRQPYRLRFLELGNEERVDAVYFAKFKALAEAIWAKDPRIILVVGDFVYDRPITDPMNFTGAASRITSLAVHQQILKLAKEHNAEVWFDVHIDTEGPSVSNSARALFSYVDALEKLADGAKHHVVVFEFNANNHEHRRALANANAIGAITRDGRIPVALSANCLQPDGQNDNGWNQGLLFLNPSKTWLQPPGYVTQMVSRNYLPNVIDAKADGGDEKLTVTATKSNDGKELVLQIVNLDREARRVQIQFEGFAPSKNVAEVSELSGPLDARNTAAEPERIKPKQVQWRHGIKDGSAAYEIAGQSFTVIRFE